jgi:hypothetical protein
MNRASFVTVAALLALAALVPAARAGDPASWGQERGFSLGLKLVVDGIGVDETADPLDPAVDDMGGGLALVGGYSWTPNFHARLTLGSAQHGTSVSDLEVLRSFGSIEAHWRFLPDRQVCPYIFGSLGGTDLRADQGGNHVKFTGGTAGIGAGLLCGLTSRWVVDMTGRLEGINWNTAEWAVDQAGGGQLQYETGIEDSGGAARLEIGVVYQF